METLLERSGLVANQNQPYTRVTLDQVVRLYQIAAVETQDEMMGLWGRSIRPRALQHHRCLRLGPSHPECAV